jgi:hypothetical protein
MSSHRNSAQLRTRRSLTLASSRSSGKGYSREKRDSRFVITDSGHKISDDAKREIEQILQGDSRKGNNVRNGSIIKDTIGITSAELIAIAQIIISSTGKGFMHKMTKKRNTNLATANSNNLQNVSSREVLKNIIKLDISDQKIHIPLKNCVLFLEGILNESRNFETTPFTGQKLRLTTSQTVSAAEIEDQLRKLGIASDA